MKAIKDNPSLSLYAIEDKIKSARNTLIVPPYSQLTAIELSEHFIQNIFRFEVNGKKLTEEEAKKKGLIDFKVIVEIKMKDTEWILITEDEIYYSKGDSANSK